MSVTDNEIINIVDPQRPYTHGRLLEDIGKLCDKYAGLISVCAVGQSVQHREIPVLSMGCGDKRVLAVGGIHGREYVTVGFLMGCIEDFAEAYCKNLPYGGFDVREIFSQYTLHLVPMCNPDSVEIALGRALPNILPKNIESYTYKNNANNVNLNANFPFLWECVPISRQGGEYAASERETKFLMELCEDNLYEKLFSFHARGDCLFWRDLGNGRVQGDEELAVALKEKCGYSLCPPTKRTEDYSGGFENWFRHRFHRAGICVELISDEDAPFDECVRDFYRLVRWEDTRYTLLVAMTN